MIHTEHDFLPDDASKEKWTCKQCHIQIENGLVASSEANKILCEYPPHDHSSDILPYHSTDLSWQTICNAYNNARSNPPRAACAEIASYCIQMQEINAEFSQWITPENSVEMKADLLKYQKKHIKLKNDQIRALDRVVGAYFVGPAGYNIEKESKHHDREHIAMGQLIHYSEYMLPKLKRKYNPKLKRNIIRSDSDTAIEDMQAKIAQLEANHAKMKAINAIVKHTQTNEDKYTALVEMGLSVKEASGYVDNPQKEVKSNKVVCVSFKGFTLTNNSAAIRNAKNRLIVLEREYSRPVSKDIKFCYTPGVWVTVRENTEAKRIQVLLGDINGDYTPQVKQATEELRVKLGTKSGNAGFRWSRKNQAWQRAISQRTRNTIERLFGDFIKEADNE